MTAADFRKLAIALPEAEERAHMDHPDFRVGGKIFATLGYPDKSCGMVKLSPEEQHCFSKAEPDVFVPVKGAWGRGGATSVHLKTAKKETLSNAIQAAWCNTAPKRLLEKS
ncbi:MAG: MmcQ/YjbR family DNA-binding protein [Candidatus Sulfotelmatobacter sp.]